MKKPTRKKRGRPESDNPRETVIKFRVTTDESRAYAIAAAAEGATLSAYVRAAINRYITLTADGPLLGETE